jgi:hypothetical protein
MNSISTQLLNSELGLSLFNFILTILSCALGAVVEVKREGSVVPVLDYDDPFKAQ